MFKLSPSSVSQLIQDYREELIGFLVQRQHCPETASDILQDAFIRLVEYKAGDNIIHNPRAFLYRVVSNLSVDYQRVEQKRKVRHADESELVNFPDRQPALEHQLYTQEQVAQLHQAIAELPPKCRQVFIMHKFKRYPYSLIMTELGISESTVLKHIVKAMEHCRKRLQEMEA